jgi:peptidoglycan/xylan/chitin deacetylase (PgdA/CDA1 family)
VPSSSPSALRTRGRATPRPSPAGGAEPIALVCRRDGLDRRLVALTFDDGPSEWTPAVLDLLERHRMGATFFVVGRYVDARPELVRRMASAGHELGNHTYDHVDAAHERDEEVLRDQLARTSSSIAAATGTPARLVRPPYGKDVCRVARLGAEAGLEPTILWSVQAWDWDETPAEEIAGHVLRGVHPGAIVVLHDGVPPNEDRSRGPTVLALETILPALEADGYEAVTVSALLAA